jgi:hypothetical protein
MIQEDLQVTWENKAKFPPSVVCPREGVVPAEAFLTIAVTDADYPAPHHKVMGPNYLVYMKANFPCSSIAASNAPPSLLNRELASYSFGKTVDSHVPHRYYVVVFAHKGPLRIEVDLPRDNCALKMFQDKHPGLKLLRRWMFWFAPPIQTSRKEPNTTKNGSKEL